MKPGSFQSHFRLNSINMAFFSRSNDFSYEGDAKPRRGPTTAVMAAVIAVAVAVVSWLVIVAIHPSSSSPITMNKTNNLRPLLGSEWTLIHTNPELVLQSCAVQLLTFSVFQRIPHVSDHAVNLVVFIKQKCLQFVLGVSTACAADSTRIQT